MRNLVSDFVIESQESIIDKLATHKISAFKLISVTEQIGLSLVRSKTPKTGIRHVETHLSKS